MRRLVLVGVAAALGAIAACGGHTCNDKGVYCALDVELRAADWQPGTYTFEATVDGRRFSCSETLPWPEYPPPQPCGDGPMRLDGWSTAITWPQKLSLMWVRPSKVEVRSVRDGVELVRKTLRPSYEDTEPNGEGCGVCSNAGESVSF